MDKNGIRPRQRAGSSVGKSFKASENKRQAAIAQAARDRQRLAVARELEELFAALFGLDQVNCIRKCEPRL